MAHTIIKATEDLFNSGKCFTKDKEYRIEKSLRSEASLMDLKIENDLGEDHIIGMWWRSFEIVERKSI